jgi:hypothetical protein
VLTTFGGDLLIWMSSDGEINAGRGAKSTTIFAPIGIAYDAYGGITLSTTAPSSGAGIATLAPIPEVPPGQVNLVAPAGTIDAGEAGIRASGRVNLAALVITNAANVSARQGVVTSIVIPPSTNLGALAAAAAVSGAAQQTAQKSVLQPPAAASVITVEVLGFGEGDSPQ